MASNISRPSGQSALLLAGISRLRDFTVAELAEYANVSVEAARSFLRRRKADVEFVGTQAHERPGRPNDVYRLLPERRDEIAKRVARLSRQLSEVDRDGSVQSRPTLLELVDASLHSVEVGEFSDSAERASELDIAEQQLAAVRASLQARRRARQPVEADEAERIVRAEQRLFALRLPPLDQPDDAARAQIRSRVHEWKWSGSPPAETGLDLDIDGEGAWLDGVMAAVRALPQSEQAYAAGLQTWRAIHRANDRQAQVRESVVHVLRARGRVRNGVELSTLALAAAISGATEAAVPLFTHILLAEQHHNGLPEVRWLCQSALAHLAGMAKDPLKAAACCLYLLSAAKDDEEKLLLIPPAFLAQAANPKTLFNLLAPLVNCAVGKQASARNALRNLGFALDRCKFTPLDEALESLLSTSSGQHLIVALRQDAIELTDSNGLSDFKVRLGEWAGRREYTRLSLKSDDEAGTRLTDIIADDPPKKAMFLRSGSQSWAVPAGQERRVEF